MKEKREITAATLKWIAVITMIIDHFGASILESWLFRSAHPYQQWMVYADIAIRAIGRMAFPIFIFLMVEGLYHTRNRWKYLGRLVLLAVISEIPFDWAFWISRFEWDNGVFIEFHHQNVFVTLSIGLFMMILLEMIRPRSMRFALDRQQVEEKGTLLEQEPVAKVIGRTVLCLAIMAGCAYANELAMADYGFTGIIGFIGMYWANVFFRVNWRTFLLGVAGLTFFNGFEVVSIIDLVFIKRYHGAKGTSMNRWFFYFVYPVHLLIYGWITLHYIL
ncbi:MAG: conjugal transfer protein TraX [Lachnospiraceae bacterium]|nr:conjugal transfer protein TraX [Lachnospiraceae bacterium]